MPAHLRLAAAALCVAAACCGGAVRFAAAADDAGGITGLSLEDVHRLTFYELLGVPTGVEVRELKKAYRKVALLTHPDKYSGPERELASQRFVAVVNAYETLADEAKREKYDAMLARGGRPESAHDGGWDDEEFYGYDDFESAYDTFAQSDLTEEAAAVGLGVAGVGMALFVALPVYLKVKHERAKAERVKRAHVEEMRVRRDTGKRGEAEKSVKQRRRETELLRQRVKERARAEAAAGSRSYVEPAREAAGAAGAADGGVLAASAERRRLAEQRAAEEKRAAGRPWSAAELSSLAKLVARFPGGTANRWQVIAKNLNSALPAHAHRPWKAVAKQAQTLNPSDIPVEAAKAAAPKPAPAANAENSASPAAAKTKTAGAGAGAGAGADAGDDWSPEQQKQLEMALKRYPPGTTVESSETGAVVERWDLIAGAVLGKSKKQCVRRFKEIRAQIRSSRE